MRIAAISSKVSRSGPIQRPKHFQRHPVIFLSFKDVKYTSWDHAFGAIKHLLRGLVRDLSMNGEAAHWSEDFQRDAAQIALRQEPPELYHGLLHQLSRELDRSLQTQVVILIDEYDTPIHSAYLNGYYEQMMAFMRSFLSGGLKDNRHLFRGVITGILRVSKESLFSGLNNIEVYSMLRARHATHSGFLEAEVAEICQQLDEPALLEGMRAMYDGYRADVLAEAPIPLYNPWSVVSCAADTRHTLRPYWVNTSSDDLLRQLMLHRGFGLTARFEHLLAGGVITMPLDESLVLRHVDLREETLWTFLWFSGYLRTNSASLSPDGELAATLAIPNQEVRLIYKRAFRDWLHRGFSDDTELKQMLKALFGGDCTELESYLSRLLLRNASFYDMGGHHPEKLYQGLILGLLVQLEGAYQVRSNVESGFGRADMLVTPLKAGKPGLVMELKILRKQEAVGTALRKALQQIEERRYVEALETAGATPIHRYALVFDGKETWVTTPEAWLERFGGSEGGSPTQATR